MKNHSPYSKSPSKLGFTLIELSLSIAFLSILSITIVLIITNAVSAYHRGLTLNDINSVGMDLVDDLRGAVQNSPYEPASSICAVVYPGNDENTTKCIEDSAAKFTSLVRRADVRIGNQSESDVPVFGAFCTGGFSYVWNSGYFASTDAIVADNNLTSAKLEVNGTEVPAFKLIKVRDRNREVCVNAVKKVGDYDSSDDINPTFKINLDNPESEPPVDLLAANNNLALYSLTVPAPADNGNNVLFYSMSFILGTVQGGVNVKASSDYCATPGGFNSDIANFDYCAINKFNFAAQATGG